MINRYILLEKNTLILGLQAGVLATVFALLQVTICSTTAYALFALIGVFLGALIQTVAIHYTIQTRVWVNIILAISAGFTTILGTYCAVSLSLMITGIIVLVPLVALSSSLPHLVAAIVLFTVDLFIVSSSVVASDISHACYYGLSFCGGAMLLALMTYLQRKYTTPTYIKHEYVSIDVIQHIKQNVHFAIALTSAVVIATVSWFIFNIPQGFWIPMTVLLVFKSDHDFTRSRMSHRLYGTLLGSVFAIIIGFSITSKLALAIIMLPLVLAIVITMAKHYGAYTLILTIMVTVMVNLTENLGYVIAEHRLIDTLIGVITVMLIFLIIRSKAWFLQLYR